MVIAGEASGDLLAAELIAALQEKLPKATFFGAGGSRMAATGMELAVDLTQHSVIGITEVMKKLVQFRRLFRQLLDLAIQRQPDVVIGVDYGGFNLRFAHAIKEHYRNNPFSKWNPKIIQFVSPQVWASRPGRADQLAADCDLLLSIFPFEKNWYAARVPQLRVEFVGHPMVQRMQEAKLRERQQSANATVLLLPGSRKGELQRHLPPMLKAWAMVQEKMPMATAKMVLPNEKMSQILFWHLARLLPLKVRLAGPPGLTETQGMMKKIFPNMEIQISALSQALAESDVALAKTGTVTMECAFAGVPTVTLYKTSWLTYQIARRIVTVKSLTMPNLLAGESVYPEFIQSEATPENISRAALGLLQEPARRQKIKRQLSQIIASLGESGATERAAASILSLFPS